MTRDFRHGLDYAFILAAFTGEDAERVIREKLSSHRILVLAPNRTRSRRAYESLQGRPEVGPLPTPRRCHAAVTKDGAVRFHRCELRSHPALASRRDP